MNVSDQERAVHWMLSRVTMPNGTDGCWLFDKEKYTQNRYGIIHSKCMGELYKCAAHRAMYYLLVGDIGDKHVLHRCDTPRCINPSHLYLGTHKENMEDRERKNRGNRPVGQRHYLAKLTEDIVYTMRMERKEKKTTYKEFAERYNVSISSVDAAINGRRWKSVEMI